MAIDLRVNGLVCVTVNPPLVLVWLVLVNHNPDSHSYSCQCERSLILVVSLAKRLYLLSHISAHVDLYVVFLHVSVVQVLPASLLYTYQHGYRDFSLCYYSGFQMSYSVIFRLQTLQQSGPTLPLKVEFHRQTIRHCTTFQWKLRDCRFGCFVKKTCIWHFWWQSHNNSLLKMHVGLYLSTASSVLQ